MRILATILTLAMLAGAAGAINYDIVRQVSNDGPTNFVVVELSGTDPAVFDQPGMAKEGLRTMIAAEVWGTPIGWNNAEDGAPFGGKAPLLTGSLAKAAYLNSPEKADLPDYVTQVESYLDERLNRSADLTVIDKLNVTEGNSTEAV